MPFTTLFADLADPGLELVALREHLERETGLLVFACRDEAGRHTASAAFPLHEDEAARLIAACGRDRSETIRTADGGFFCSSPCPNSAAPCWP